MFQIKENIIPTLFIKNIKFTPTCCSKFLIELDDSPDHFTLK